MNKEFAMKHRPLIAAACSLMVTVAHAQKSIKDVAVDAPKPEVVARARPADAGLCARMAGERNLLGAPYESWILFNTTGAVCYAPFPLRQRDTLHFGVVVAKGEQIPSSVSVNITGCTVPTPGPVVFSSSPIPEQFKPNSTGQPQVPIAPVDQILEVATRVACASEAPVAAVSINNEGQAAVSASSTLSLYPRHTATVHLGVLNSKLREPDFGLRASGGQMLITDREADTRGPQYVALVVVQALPRYLRAGGLSYPGRDLLHDNEVQDRLGLALAFGLKEPTKRFGFGLTYELAKGINVVAVREWVKRSQLDGAQLGDAFTGAATDIPKRQAWSKDWSFGLSFDIGYVTSVFSGGK